MIRPKMRMEMSHLTGHTIGVRVTGESEQGGRWSYGPGPHMELVEMPEDLFFKLEMAEGVEHVDPETDSEHWSVIRGSVWRNTLPPEYWYEKDLADPEPTRFVYFAEIEAVFVINTGEHDRNRL